MTPAQPPTADRRAAEHRQRADRRRDARHQRRRTGPLPDRDGRPGRPPDGAPRRPRPGHRGVPGRPRPVRPRRLDRRAGPDPGRPDPRGDRRRRAARHRRRPGPRGLAARAVGPARHALPGAQPQAGVADPVRRSPAQPERDGAGLVRRPAGWSGHRGPARARRARCARCGRTTSCRASRRRPRRRGRGADLPAGGDRRVPGRRTARRGAPAGDQPDRRDVCPGRGRRRPDLAPWPKAAGPPRSSSRPRPRSSSATSASTSGRPARRPGARRSARGSASSAGRWRPSRSAPAGASDVLLGDAPWVRFDESIGSDSPAADGSRRRRPGRDDDALGSDARRASRVGRASSAVPTSAWRSGRGRGRATRRSRSRSRRHRRERRVRRLVFLTGPMGRSRAALSAAAFLLETLRDQDAPD